MLIASYFNMALIDIIQSNVHKKWEINYGMLIKLIMIIGQLNLLWKIYPAIEIIDLL